jgi:hypothetical protein
MSVIGRGDVRALPVGYRAVRPVIGHLMTPTTLTDHFQADPATMA